jgi:ubiquinol-cytochrome c reductase cytochrome c1 subunit
MARDIVLFLAWASEPNMEERKSMGMKVMLFLIVFTGLLIAVKRRVWADIH